MNALSSVAAAPEGGRRPITRLFLALVSTLLAGLVVAPATAAAAGPAKEPVSILFLRISPVDTQPIGPGNPPPDVWFTCSRDGSVDERSTHPTPEEACASLRAVDGDFEALPARQGFCPAVWAPVRVEAQGLWYPNEGDDYGNVRYEAEFANRCVARLSTDNVFNF